jgi:phage terminase small subunit
MNLSPQQEKFIECYLADETNASAAYIKAGYKVNQTSAHTLAARALQRPAIKQAIDARRQLMREAAHLSRMDIVGFLCETIKTPIGKIDENHRQAQESHIEEGEIKSSTKIKMPGKLEAVKILVQMMGWNEPEKHSHTLNVIIGGDAE